MHTGMNRSWRNLVAVAAVLASGAAGMQLLAQEPKHEHHHAAAAAAPAAALKQHAVAVMNPLKDSKVSGLFTLQDTDAGLRITGEVTGLTPNAQHAIHIHEFGDNRSPDGSSAGSHYNPEGHPHGLPDKDQRHAGDLGNLQADAQGKATLDFTAKDISIAGKNAVAGRSIIIHAKPDDGGQPTGNAGGRISQGVILVVAPPKS